VATDDRGYLQWMVGPRRGFPDELKDIVGAALEGVFPVRPAAAAAAAVADVDAH
jgi:hypothetical protein